MINSPRRKVLEGMELSPGIEVIDVFCFTDRKDYRNGERGGQTSGEHKGMKTSDLTSPARGVQTKQV